MVTVGQLMKKELITVDPGTSVIEAAKLMRRLNITSVLVRHQCRIIGLVTESDIVKKVVGADRPPSRVPVEDIMSTPLVGIEERCPLTEAADLMSQYQSLHLGVMKDGTVVGVLSVGDLLRPVATDEL
ncbi:MAG: CBS domain-containing protein [Nitrospira sp.]|nr:CBS domain-containing protein [Nitrospira sp.]